MIDSSIVTAFFSVYFLEEFDQGSYSPVFGEFYGLPEEQEEE